MTNDSLINIIKFNYKRIISHQKLVKALNAANPGTPVEGPEVIERRTEDLREILITINTSLKAQEEDIKHLKTQASIDKAAATDFLKQIAHAKKIIEELKQQRITVRRETKALEKLAPKVKENKKKIAKAKTFSDALINAQNEASKIEAEAKETNIEKIAKLSSDIEHELFFRNYLDADRLAILSKEIRSTVKKPGLEVDHISLAEILSYNIECSWNVGFVNKITKKLISLIPTLNANQSKSLKEIFKKWSMDNPNSIAAREFAPVIIDESNKTELADWIGKTVRVDDTLRANLKTRFGKAISDSLKAHSKVLSIGPREQETRAIAA